MSDAVPAELLSRYRQHWLLEHLMGQRWSQRVSQRLGRDQPSVLQAALLERLRQQGPGRTVPIERRKALSLEEFRRVYLRLGLPVIWQGGAKQWPCVQNWSPAWLAERYGDDPLSLIDAAPSDAHEIDYQVRQTTLGALIREMDEKPLEKYSRFNRLLYDHPELAHDFDQNWLKAHRNPVCSGQTFQVFIGGKGSRTHLHAASEHNLFTQVYGQKHWVIYPPSYDCVLRPPVNRTPYFHSVFNPDAPDFAAFPAMATWIAMNVCWSPGIFFFCRLPGGTTSTTPPVRLGWGSAGLPLATLFVWTGPRPCSPFWRSTRRSGLP